MDSGVLEDRGSLCGVGELLKDGRVGFLDIIVSNTTEAGLDYQRSEWNPDEPVLSYPGKLTKLLYRRYEHYEGSPDKGLMILPCELLERNGDILRSIVLRHAQDWGFRRPFRAGWRSIICS